MLREPAYAKINLFLEVIGRQSDGRHHLQSLMVFADVGEWVTLEPADTFGFTVSGPQKSDLASAGHDNLVVRAARLFMEYAKPPSNVNINLHKVMPIASGIGGGSADAGATLRGLNRLFGSPCNNNVLVEMGAQLGADVPACLVSAPVVLNGAAMQLAPARVSTPNHIILANPRRPVSTEAVFKALDAARVAAIPDLVQQQWTLGEITRRRNDLAVHAMRICPHIKAVLAALKRLAQVEYVQMSGSGATCLALFSTAKAADQALKALKMQHAAWWTVRAQLLPL